MSCPVCGGELIQDTRPLKILYKDLSQTVDMPGDYCVECGEGIISSEGLRISDKALAELKAKNADVYTPDEITEIREALHLNKLEAGRILGGGVRSFQRYEEGSVTVSKPMHNLLKLVSKHPDLIEELRD
ncbi:MAG: XRE family transcriptional regulator [Sulfitobacter sp.]|nr:MAG: XRE family transcriptional regulator [Sulfitobacter sp.]